VRTRTQARTGKPRRLWIYVSAGGGLILIAGLIVVFAIGSSSSPGQVRVGTWIKGSEDDPNDKEAYTIVVLVPSGLCGKKDATLFTGTPLNLSEAESQRGVYREKGCYIAGVKSGPVVINDVAPGAYDVIVFKHRTGIMLPERFNQLDKEQLQDIYHPLSFASVGPVFVLVHRDQLRVQTGKTTQYNYTFGEPGGGR